MCLYLQCQIRWHHCCASQRIKSRPKENIWDHHRAVVYYSHLIPSLFIPVSQLMNLSHLSFKKKKKQLGLNFTNKPSVLPLPTCCLEQIAPSISLLLQSVFLFWILSLINSKWVSFLHKIWPIFKANPSSFKAKNVPDSKVLSGKLVSFLASRGKLESTYAVFSYLFASSFSHSQMHYCCLCSTETVLIICCCCSVAKLCPTLWAHGLQLYTSLLYWILKSYV